MLKREFIIVTILLTSCARNVSGVSEDFVFTTVNIEGDEAYYSKAAVVTGDIANRDVYPNTTEISLTLPFYDRVDSRQTSRIHDDEFGFSVLPYAPRTVSMAPFVDHMVICPGDSIHVELDFAELGKWCG